MVFLSNSLETRLRAERFNVIYLRQGIGLETRLKGEELLKTACCGLIQSTLQRAILGRRQPLTGGIKVAFGLVQVIICMRETEGLVNRYLLVVIPRSIARFTIPFFNRPPYRDGLPWYSNLTAIQSLIGFGCSIFETAG